MLDKKKKKKIYSKQVEERGSAIYQRVLHALFVINNSQRKATDADLVNNITL